MTKPEIETRPEKSNVQKYSLERLRRDCDKLFGVNVATFDGATLHLRGEHTIDVVKGNIEKFLKRAIRIAPRKEEKDGKK